MDTRLDLLVAARHRRSTRAVSGAALLPVLAPAGGLVVGVLALVLLLGGNGASLFSGLVAGAAAGAWVAIRQGRARAASSPAAARAERRTEDELRPLERSGWRFLHDVPGPDGSYDHIAVGRGGVILLESLNPDGVVLMRGGEPIVERRESPDAPARVQRLRSHVRADAGYVRDTVQKIASRRMWVQAVAVIWSEFPAGCVSDGRCVYIHGSRLAEWLERRPPQLDDAQAEAVFGAVEVLAQNGGELPLPVTV